MGYYIEVPENHGKAQQLVDLHGGQIVPTIQHVDKIPAGKVLVVVVENGPFDAVGVVFSQRELEDFSYLRDTRRKTHVLLDRQTAFKLQPRVEKVMQY